MVHRSLRDWISELRDGADFVDIDEAVSTTFEIAAYIKKSCNRGGPAFRFRNVDEHSMDVVGGLYGTKSRVLSSLDVDDHEAGMDRYTTASENPIEPVIVDDGPVREVIDTDPDLSDVPIVRHNEHDDGHYVTAGIQVVNLPHTGVRGQGIYRMPRHDDTHLGLYSSAERRVGRAYRINGDNDEPTDLAIVIGASPAVTMGSIANVPHTVDKYGVAGGLQEEPIELVRCETIDVDVPADAEMVIEGRIHPDHTMEEGPFGEYPGCYSGGGTIPLVEVTAITRREDAMYHTILTGFPPTENNLMNWIGESATVKQDAERAVPEVNEATVKCGTAGGNGRYEAFVSINKRVDGEPWNVILSVLGGRTGAKYCTVVDGDVDVYDERQLNWALNTRVQPRRDVYRFPRMVGASLDPSGSNRQSDKLGIDATIPLEDDRESYRRVAVPGIDDVDW